MVNLRLKHWPTKLRRYAPLGFITGALVFGGAGSQHPLAGLSVTVLALVVVALSDAGSRGRLVCPAYDRIDRAALWLCALVFALVCIQIVPLPPAVWQSLPGRSIVKTVDAAQGRVLWRPLSLAPDRTLDMALALIGPIVAFCLARSATAADRLQWVRALIVCAMIAALLGLVQLATGPEGGFGIWETIHAGSGVGWFVNRNHQAVFLLVAIVLGGVPESMVFEPAMQRAHVGRIEQGVVVGATFVLLAAGVLATLSRTGVALLPFALCLAVGLRRPGRYTWLIVGGSAVAVAVLLVAANTAIGDALLNRYGVAPQDERFSFWVNTLHAIRLYFPFGSGFGSFVGVYQMVEPLGQVDRAYVVHAHDDYLEWLLEGGVLMIAVVGAALICLLARFIGLLRLRRVAKRNQRPPVLVFAALGAIAVMALASVTDFPLRMAALGVVFGLCAGIAARPWPIADAKRRVDGVPGPWRKVFAPGLALVLAMLAISADVSLDRALANDGGGATQWASWRASGRSISAIAQSQRGHLAGAQSDAAAALAIDPLDPGAVRVMGLTAQVTGQSARAGVMASVAEQLGWRDQLSQVWLAKVDEAQDRLPDEARRIDALLRQNTLADPSLDFLVGLVDDSEGRAVIVARLLDSPGWAQGFFNRLSGAAADQPGAIVALVHSAVRAGLPITPRTLTLITWALAEHGHADAVRALRHEIGDDAALDDGNFASASGRLPDQSGPYAWHRNAAASGDVYIGQGDDTHGRALHVLSDGHPVFAATHQWLLLTPGRYRLNDRWTVVDGDRTTRPHWVFRCLTPGNAGPDQGADLAVTDGVVVIPAGCDQQDLRLDVANAAGGAFHVAFQNVGIDSIR